MYERLNSTFNWLSGGISSVTPGVPLRALLDELAVVTGIIDWQMPRDEGLVFLRLGSNLERLDMTSRLLEIDHESSWPDAGAATALRAVGALNPFLHTQRAMDGEQVVGFLVLDPEFPRSMLHCAKRAESAVRRMAAAGPPGADRSSAAHGRHPARRTGVRVDHAQLHRLAGPVQPRPRRRL